MTRFFCIMAVLAAFLPAPRAHAESQAEFIGGLVDREAVTYADGVRGVALLLNPAETVPSFEEAQSLLAGKKIINAKWQVQATAPLTKGKIAYMLFKTLGLKDGLGDLLFGLSEGSAIDECFRNDLIANGKPDQPVGKGMPLILSLRQAMTRLGEKSKSQEADLVKIDIDAVAPPPPQKKDAQEALLRAISAGLKKPSAEVGGSIAAVRGPVWVREGEKEWSPAGGGAAVPVGAEILTGIASQAQVSLPDGTVILMKPLTQLALAAAGSGTCSEGTFYVIRGYSTFGVLRVSVGANSFLSCVQIGSPRSYITALDGAFEQSATGAVADTTYAGSKGRISVVQGAW